MRAGINGFGRMGRLARLFGNDAATPSRRADFNVPDSLSEGEPPTPMAADQAKPGEAADLARAFDALRMPVVLVDGRLMVLQANEEARHVFGDKIRGRSFALFFRDAGAIEQIEDTLNDGQARQVEVNMEVPLKRQYRLGVARLASRPGAPTQAVLEFQETTLIRRSETLRSEFVANVSHELRSPLATLIGFIETLREDGADAAARDRFLGIMEGEAQRMRRLIDDLLSLTNVELREHERPRARIDVGEVLREVADSLMPRASARSLDIHMACPDDLPAVLGERDQLIQVFHNLLTNAIKYGSDGERIEISAEALANGLPDNGASIEVRVRDYGQGIAPEHLPRLTERFYRVDKGRSRAMGGTGLGLAIVKHIVNRHRGRLHVESDMGRGTTFKIRLPAYRDDVPDASATNL